MNHKHVAHMLSKPARDLLIEHIDGATFVEVPVIAGERGKVRNSLLNQGLIRYGSRDQVSSELRWKSYSARPTLTWATENGRLVMAHVLADYAEALILAGYRIEAGGDPSAIVVVAKRIAESPSMVDIPVEVEETRVAADV